MATWCNGYLLTDLPSRSLLATQAMRAHAFACAAVLGAGPHASAIAELTRNVHSATIVLAIFIRPWVHLQSRHLWELALLLISHAPLHSHAVVGAFSVLDCLLQRTQRNLAATPPQQQSSTAKLSAVGFEATPLWNGALSHRLKPLSQTVTEGQRWYGRNEATELLFLHHRSKS